MVKAESSIDIDDVPPLIEAAYAEARGRGKTDWKRMTTAVLKNRVLGMTGRRFDETALGFTSFVDLLATFPSLVRLDRTTRPPTVEFLGDTTKAPAPPGNVQPTRLRVRQDLWNAILDYSAGHDWVWDASAGSARPIEQRDDTSLVLPTLTREDLGVLRDVFTQDVQLKMQDDGRELERLERWRSKGLGTAALPVAIQGLWNEHLKSVVVERLTQWFAQHDISVPSDLLRVEAVAAPRPDDQELLALRALIIDCVRSMTLSELASLNLPAGAVIRTQTRLARHRDES